MDKKTEINYVEPVSQEDYEKQEISKAIDEWGNGNRNGIKKIIPIEKDNRYRLFILMVIMGVTLLLEIVIAIYLFTKAGM
jgi:hypothetical protein